MKKITQRTFKTKVACVVRDSAGRPRTVTAYDGDAESIAIGPNNLADGIPLWWPKSEVFVLDEAALAGRWSDARIFEIGGRE